jgi:hypothetical protein
MEIAPMPIPKHADPIPDRRRHDDERRDAGAIPALDPDATGPSVTVAASPRGRRRCRITQLLDADGEVSEASFSPGL